MTIPFGHHHLSNRYTFTGEMELITPLRISSGRASDDTDAPFIVTFTGIPYIPGSSLRGAIRSEIERIITVVGSTAGINSCILFESGNCNDKIRDYECDIEENQLQGEDNKSRDTLITEFAESALCDVCRLFGSTAYASRLVIEDALPESSGNIRQYMQIRDGVGIDRDTGAARDGAKFDYEVIESGANGPVFIFKMVAENVTEKDMKLLRVIIRVLKEGLYVGGKRSGGLGKIKLKSDYVVAGFTDAATMWNDLISGREINRRLAWQEVL